MTATDNKQLDKLARIEARLADNFAEIEKEIEALEGKLTDERRQWRAREQAAKDVIKIRRDFLAGWRKTIDGTD